ncbi:MAG: hypothetical protein WBC31_07030, partial [Candidatus Phosphoribacter baldrii]
AMRFTRITYAGVGLAAAAGLGMSGTALAQAREDTIAEPPVITRHDSQAPDRIVTPVLDTVVRIMRLPVATSRSRQ